MDGQKVFEKLNAMSEEERKQCSFWWLTDKRLNQNLIEGIVFDNKDFVDETVLNEVADTISADDIVIIYKEIEDEISEYSVDTYWDEYSSILINKLREKIDEKLREKGLKLLED
jgi:galactitol-specific phosphotransferase system IIB component